MCTLRCVLDDPAGIIPLRWCGSDYVRVKRLCGCCDLVHCQHRAASVVLRWLSAGFKSFSFIIAAIFDPLFICLIWPVELVSY